MPGFLRAREGTTSVEFAICGVVLFGFLLAIVNLGLLGFAIGAMARSVQATARASAAQASASYAAAGSFTCPAFSSIVTSFNGYAGTALPALAASSTTANSGTETTGNLTLTAHWSNNGGGSNANAPAALYLTLTGTYTWHPFGWNLFGAAGVPFSITTAAIVTGSNQASTSCS